MAPDTIKVTASECCETTYIKTPSPSCR